MYPSRARNIEQASSLNHHTKKYVLKGLTINTVVYNVWREYNKQLEKEYPQIETKRTVGKHELVSKKYWICRIWRKM
jgi:hypothetical protein